MEMTSPAVARRPLRRALAVWYRRGYRLLYCDASLAQLARPAATRQTTLRLALALLILVLPVLLVLRLLARRWRRWHVVTLTIGPEERIVTHEMWSPRLPQT